MGAYSERIASGYKARSLSPEDIRAAKCQRSKMRNAERKAARIQADAERHAKTKPQDRRQYRRENLLKEFAVSA